MPKKDAAEIAHRVFMESIGEADSQPVSVRSTKNAAAVALGRQGGIASAKKRNAALSPEERQAIGEKLTSARLEKRSKAS